MHHQQKGRHGPSARQRAFRILFRIRRDESPRIPSDNWHSSFPPVVRLVTKAVVSSIFLIWLKWEKDIWKFKPRQNDEHVELNSYACHVAYPSQERGKLVTYLGQAIAPGMTAFTTTLAKLSVYSPVIVLSSWYADLIRDDLEDARE